MIELGKVSTSLRGSLQRTTPVVLILVMGTENPIRRAKSSTLVSWQITGNLVASLSLAGDTHWPHVSETAGPRSVSTGRYRGLRSVLLVNFGQAARVGKCRGLDECRLQYCTKFRHNVGQR